MTSLRRVLFTSACAALVLASQAKAATVNRTVTFDPGSAGTFFSADLNGSGSLIMSANAQISLSLGSVLSISPTLTVPSQTFNFNESATLTSDPTGNMTLQLPDTPETFGGTYPNLAGALTEADIPQLDVTLVGSSGINILNLSETLTGSTTVDILGITDLDFPVTADLDVTGILKNVIYSQVGNALIGPGNVTNPNGPAPGSPPGSITTAYEIPGPATGGVVSGGSASLGAEAIVGGDITIDLGIFGSFDQSLSPTSVVDETVPVDLFALLFDMYLTDLEPLLFGGPRDINVDIDGNFDLAGPLSFDFDDSGNVAIPTTNFSTPVNLGVFGNVTIDGTVTGTLNYALDTDITLSNLQYGLEDEVVADVLVPEPSSIMLVVMGLVALMPVVARRRKNS